MEDAIDTAGLTLIPDKETTFPWYQAAIALFQKQEGKRAVEIVAAPVSVRSASDAAVQSSTSLWCGCATTVDSLRLDQADGTNVVELPDAEKTNNLNVFTGDPINLLKQLDGAIDLLYLDGWPIGTPEYQERHADVYRAVRNRLNERSIVLVGNTSRDHGGKSRLVLPLAFEDGFHVLLWGSLTLLARASLATVRSLLPRVGPPVPADALLDDAIRLHRDGFTWEAEQIYRHILRQWPDHTSALHLLGVVLHQIGNDDEALRLIGRAIALDPAKSAFFNNYGATLLAKGCHVEAMACFYRALQLQPDYIDAESNLGLVLGKLGRDKAAMMCFQKVLQRQPHHVDTVKRLADLLLKQGKEGDVIELLRTSIAERPNAELCVNLGNLLVSSGRSDLAIAEYKRAIDVSAENAEAWFNQGVAYQDQRMLPEARSSFDRAVGLCPERPFWRLRRLTAGPVVFRNVEEIDAYRVELNNILDDWLADPPPRVSWNELAASDAIGYFNLAYHGCNNRVVKEKFAVLYQRYFQDLPEPTGSRMSQRKRIGFLVTQRHQGIFLRCMKGILEHLDRQDYEVVILCSHAIVASIRDKIRREDLKLVSFGRSIAEAVSTIRESACDLIYHWEIGSDAINYFLPFARLAPVQCTSHGSLITSGNPAVQYFLSSEWTEPPDAKDHYTESFWKSRTLLFHESRVPPVPPVSRNYFPIPETGPLYVCLQNPLKLHPDIDALLGGILSTDSSGTIVLLGGRQERVVTLLKERFAQSIPEHFQRIMLLPWQKYQDYCRLLQLADVILDPPHYTAGSSIYDILSFHQPIVTMRGELAVGRVTAGYYRKMGMDDIVASSPEQYVQTAVRIATDRDYRLSIRHRIEAAAGAVFDDAEAVREHERFFSEAIAYPSPQPLRENR
jgi:predicted O-linked N-acetylglucosamine transferase (SPINDLY family)